MLTEDQFWSVMTNCPGVRKAVLGNMAMRLAKVQQATFQQEKMAALGTLAAGLMHELNNPGTAARRASTQLRENLTRMHRLSAKWARLQLSEEQKQCLYELQEFALSAKPAITMSSLEQSDAEEALAEWMEAAEIEDAWRVAPALVSVGIEPNHLDCARQTFAPSIFSDAVNWLEALVSSMQLVGTIEESIGRVTELVAAVKSYAYESRGQKQSIDINRSIIATLIIVGHKLREKQITVVKELSRDLPLLHTDCQGLNQIWTNLLDNAIDAAPQGGRIGLKTWAEGPEGQQDIFILVSDNGSGVPLEIQPHIFDAFYTTKPAGVGTGLGLGIVHRIVEQFGGSIRFASTPGETEFVVRLPNRT
jgi:signal transduction histidine kinase